MFKWETHLHVKGTSDCAMIGIDDIIRTYNEIGYYGIIMTNHYKINFRDMEQFIQVNQQFEEAGKNSKLKILTGMELSMSNEKGYNEYLLYGFDAQMLRDNKNLHTYDLKKLYAVANECGALIYQAHPFRSYVTPAPAEYLHGIEIFNGNPRHNSANDKALEYAKQNNLKMLSGSDYHTTGDDGTGGIVVEDEISDIRQFVDYINNPNKKFKFIINSNIVEGL